MAFLADVYNSRRKSQRVTGVGEAIAYVNSCHPKPAGWQCCHLVATDSAGECAVIESRNGELSMVEADVVAN